jgi:hypothetical protein
VQQVAVLRLEETLAHPEIDPGQQRREVARHVEQADLLAV